VNDNKKNAEKAYSGELFTLLVKEGQVKEIWMAKILIHHEINEKN